VALQSGTRLGVYEIVALLGAGGMGEVYRAKDSKLKRDVALKVLPVEVANDRELFFHSLDNKIVAAPITTAGDRIEVGSLTPLFDARAPDGFARFFYDVASDGRFLLSVPSASTSSAQINLLVNWPRLADGR
jgi:serine/threonine protein kinase